MLPESELKKYILKNLSTYMRKSFSIFTDPTYKPDKKIFDGAVNYMVNLVKNNRDLRRAAREIKGRSRTIEKYLESIEKRAYDLAKANKDLYNTKTTSPSSQKHYLDQVLTYLQGGLRLN